MSIKIMSLVWETDLSGSQKLVLLALADAANDEGYCWPSLNTIAKKVCLQKRYVVDIIKCLADKKYIVKKRRGTTSTMYHVLPELVRRASLPSEAGITTASEAGITTLVRRASLKPSINHQLNHKEPALNIPEKLNTPEFCEAWSEWVEYRREIKHKITDSTANKQLKKLSGYPVVVAIGMIEQSIEKGWQGLFDLKDSSVHSGNGKEVIENPDGSMYV
jgi:hypothetical protein